MLGPGRDSIFLFIAGAGIFDYCRGRAGIGIFLLSGPGRDSNFFINGVGAGPGLKFFIAGAGAGQGSEFFFIAGVGPRYKFFYCRDRAEIYIFLLPGPGLGRDQKFLNDRGQAGTGKIENAGAGIGIFLLLGRVGIQICLSPGSGSGRD